MIIINMKKEDIIEIIKKYLDIFPHETKRLQKLLEYINVTNDNLMCDWNNVLGHLTAGAFIYSQNTKKFLVLWHKDLQMYLYAGGHCELKHESILETAKIEIVEETGIKDFSIKKICENELVPIDIDVHTIPHNSRVNMPEHLHFDFRYVFLVDCEEDVKIDKNEISTFKWIDEKELELDKHYGSILKKIKRYL